MRFKSTRWSVLETLARQLSKVSLSCLGVGAARYDAVDWKKRRVNVKRKRHLDSQDEILVQN